MSGPPVFWAQGPWASVGEPLPGRAVDLHVAESRRAILDAADAANARTVLVLGAGECREIPVAALAEQCARVILCDADPQALARGIRDLPDRRRLELWVGDLVGLREPIRALTADALALTPHAIADRLALLEPTIPALPLPCDLLVVSCVLNQLHVVPLTDMIAALPQVAADPVWLEAARALSLRMEDAFLERMADWITPGGRVYFSETVEATIVRVGEGGSWARVGQVTMSRTPELAAMLPRGLRVERRGGWSWIPARLDVPGTVGCIYRVEAATLRKCA